MSVEKPNNLEGSPDDDTEEIDVSVIEEARLQNMVDSEEEVIVKNLRQQKSQGWHVARFDTDNVHLAHKGSPITLAISRKEFLKWQDDPEANV